MNRKQMMRRRAPFLLYLLAVVAVTASIVSFGWVRTWSSVQVPAMYPPFADMRFIQGAVITVEEGLDPRISNPGDHWGRLFNYPMVWIAIGKAIKLTDQSRFILVCTAVTLCFASICALLIFQFPSFWLLASLVSTATLLGIERGNIDLIIFCILVPAALWLAKFWSPIPILLGSALKLYPVFALSSLLIKRQYRLFVASMLAAVGIVAYLWDQLAAIRLNAPNFCGLGFGVPMIETCISWMKLPHWTFAITLGLIGIATLAAAYHFNRQGDHETQRRTAFDLMLVGASIYVGTFIFSCNVDYRLIFLILCIPCLHSSPFPHARIVMSAILVAMNQTLVTHWFPGTLVLVWFAKISVFVVLGGYLLALARATFAALRTKPSVSQPAS